MRCYLVILYAVSFVFSTLSNLLPRVNENTGYECGEVFFTDQIIENVVAQAAHVHHHGFDEETRQGMKEYPPKFFGKLYPIEKKYRAVALTEHGEIINPFRVYTGPYHVVVDEDFKVVDMLVRTTNRQFTKCIKKLDGSASESQSLIPGQSNGFRCGYEFFLDDLIFEMVELALNRIGSGETYPELYRGSLYNEDLNLLIWPMFDNGRVYKHYTPSNKIGPYFLVLDQNGKLIDVLVRSSNYSFVKCLRDSNDLLDFDEIPSSFLYKCDKVTFEERELKIAAKAANKPKLATIFAKFPLPYDGPPFKRPCILWPLFKNKIFTIGSAGKHRVVMTPTYEIIGAARWDGKHLIPCEKTQIIEQKHNDIYDYKCHQTVFPNSRLFQVSQIACSKLDSRKHGFPRKYSEYKFDVEGPYYIYPLILNREYTTGSAGKHRVVINKKCEFAGAITWMAETFFKCERIIEKK